MVDLLFSALATLISTALNSAVDLILGAFELTREEFDKVFPFAAAAYDIFRDIALIIVVYIAICQIISFVKSGERNRETPMSILGNSMIAVLGIFMGNYILEAIVTMTSSGFNALLEENVTVGWPQANFMAAVTSVISQQFYNVSIVLYIIILVMIGIQFVMVLLEAVERYVVLFCLLYLSPLAFSTLASKITGMIFKRFLSMFISQCLLMILNVWSVKMAISVFTSIGTIGNNDTIIVPLIMAYAFLRVAQRFDTYLSQLGLNAAITGAGLGMNLMYGLTSIVRSAGGAFGAILPGSSSGGPSGGGSSPGGVVGAAQNVARSYGKYSMAAGVTDSVKNQVHAQTSTILGAVGVGAEAARSGDSFAKAAKSHYDSEIGSAKQAASVKTVAHNVPADIVAAPAGYDTATEALADRMIDSDTELTEKEAKTISQMPSVGTVTMNKVNRAPVGTEIRDTDKNIAMLSGMGIQGAENFVRAGHGTLNNAGELESITDKNGMSFVYNELNKAGEPTKTRSLEVKNAQQYAALSTEEKSGFQQIRTADGTKKYVRYDGIKEIPPEADAAADDFEAGGASGDNNPPTPPDTGYTEAEVQAAYSQAYDYHSGKDLDDISPAAAGEIMDGYTNEGVMPYKVGTGKAHYASGGSSQGGAVEAEGTVETSDASSGNERTVVQSSEGVPFNKEDHNVDRIHKVATSTGSRNVPRKESVVQAHQNKDGIHMTTNTGTWEMRPQKYVDNLPEEKRSQFKKDYVSPRGTQYYTRFTPRSAEARANAEPQEKKQDQTVVEQPRGNDDEA